MPKTIINTLLAASVTLFLLGNLCAQDFSADLITTDRSGVAQGKVFCTTDKTRMEVPKATTITRSDLNVVWVLLPEEKIYMELPLEQKPFALGLEQFSGELERKLIAKEPLNGVMTDKYEVLAKLENKEQPIFIWTAQGSNYPVKVATADGSWSIEYKNLVVAEQPDELFEIPPEYERFTSQPAIITSD